MQKEECGDGKGRLRGSVLRDPVVRGAFGVWLVLLTIPYLLAWHAAGTDWVYSGLLFNPLDGHTYLAKMRQGWEGAWAYRLAFTPQPGPGRPVFLFYLFGGHLARWLHLSLPFAFHLLRLSGAVVLFWVLACWMDQTLLDPLSRRWALLLAAFGGGLGWLAWLLDGYFTADFWVAEAYPFLSALTNAHFPWALALTLALMLPEGRLADSFLRRAGLAFLLGWISPFGLTVAAVVDVVMSLWLGKESHPWSRITATIAGAAVPTLVVLWSLHSQPQLAASTRQIRTPMMSWQNTVISFSPALLVAVAGISYRLVHREHPLRKMYSPGLTTATTWIVVAGVLSHVPGLMQRRLLIGVYVPIASLAIWAIRKYRRSLMVALVFLSWPTLWILMSSRIYIAAQHAPLLYLSRMEADALSWVSTHTSPGTVVVASPELGAFIPGQTGRFVVYGHPFESVSADTSRRQVEEFFAGRLGTDWLQQWYPLVVFYGPREQMLGTAVTGMGLPVWYTNDQVTVYGFP